MPKGDINPLEQEILDLGDVYAELVLDLAEMFAPFRPWWEADLTPDQQLWRYIESRKKFMPWLIEAMPYMGWETWEEAMEKLDELFFSPFADAAIPITLQASVPVELLELVQAEPEDAVKHIRKMERMLAERLPAMEALASSEEVYPDEPPEPPGTVIPPASLINDVPLTPGPAPTSAPVAPPPLP